MECLVNTKMGLVELVGGYDSLRLLLVIPVILFVLIFINKTGKLEVIVLTLAAAVVIFFIKFKSQGHVGYE